MAISAIVGGSGGLSAAQPARAAPAMRASDAAIRRQDFTRPSRNPASCASAGPSAGRTTIAGQRLPDVSTTDAAEGKPRDIRHIDFSSAPNSRRPLRSEEHTSELQSLMRSSYAVFCLKNKKTIQIRSRSEENTHERQPSNHSTDDP